MAVEKALREAIAAYKRNTRGVKKHDGIRALLEDVLERMDTVGQREARNAHQSRARYRVGTSKTPRPQKITEQPTHSGQIPSGKPEEFAQRKNPS